MGIETVAIFSEADRGAAYLELADEAYCVGPAKGADSYRKIDRVISAAEIGNVQAIHPGYGFLSENAHFNQVCRDCKIDFIGPTPQAMARLGDKNSARQLAREAKVPVVPGSDGLIDDEATAVRFAHEIGFPVLVKASAGGGGRGMRVALNELVLKMALQQARAEAEAAFGDGSIYLGKVHRASAARRGAGAGRPARQRDPSVGARLFDPKASSEADRGKPLAAAGAETRNAICESAVRLVKAAGYTNAGTVEFIVDQSGNFYFIEVNARIQVEHPVTELVTGIDLIKAQIRVAAGEPLWLQQKGRRRPRRGHRMPHQRGGSDQEFSALARKDRAPDGSRRLRRAVRFARPSGLHRLAPLRFDDR